MSRKNSKSINKKEEIVLLVEKYPMTPSPGGFASLAEITAEFGELAGAVKAEAIRRVKANKNCILFDIFSPNT
jgi:hypothetical protein